MLTPAAHPPASRLWTAQDVAAYRVGRHLRYEPATVQAWLDRRLPQSTKEE